MKVTLYQNNKAKEQKSKKLEYTYKRITCLCNDTTSFDIDNRVNRKQTYLCLQTRKLIFSNDTLFDKIHNIFYQVIYS
jgi:hypothetical protein